jgi:N-acetylmuramoyl-L-alanine amidase
VPTRPPDRLRRLPLLLLLSTVVLSLHTLPAAGQGPERPLVVIDAGHGGEDPGALGPGGSREKDVTLGIARELEALLRADSGLEVRMTRDRDTLIALRDRPRLANRWRGASTPEGRPALFLSIHANAHRDPAARGYESYFLSEAKTEDARRVAEMENAAQTFDRGEPADDAMGFILNDLRRNLYLRDSSDWAALLQARLAAAEPGPDRGVKQAGFLVLDGAFMPAVLVEVGFITNPAEEALLSDPAAQRRFASELAAAVRDFFASTAARE